MEQEYDGANPGIHQEKVYNLEQEYGGAKPGIHQEKVYNFSNK
jgi:hypothetical protein